MYGLCIGLSMVEYLHAAHYVNQYIRIYIYLALYIYISYIEVI